jgi:hypothetical protein
VPLLHQKAAKDRSKDHENAENGDHANPVRHSIRSAAG